VLFYKLLVSLWVVNAGGRARRGEDGVEVEKSAEEVVMEEGRMVEVVVGVA
jgi:hypothetical protein